MRCALLALALLVLPVFAAPEPAVEVSVTAVELDDSAKPFIAEVEVTLTNRSESTIQSCDIELRYLDAGGKTLMLQKHALASLDLAPGAEMLTSFQDVDPPQGWARTVTVVAKCH